LFAKKFGNSSVFVILCLAHQWPFIPKTLGVSFVTELTSGLKNPIVGIMQPYYFPYEGYFSYILNCDTFVLHENVQYTKKGWINRNRILNQSGVTHLTLPLKDASDRTYIGQRVISESFDPLKQFRLIEGTYRKAPFWSELSDFLPNLLHPESSSLFDHLFLTISVICNLLEIETTIMRSSDYGTIEDLRGQELVLELCKRSGAASYLNPSGGRELYSHDVFAMNGINLAFIEYSPAEYVQSSNKKHSDSGSIFQQRLSILDTLAEVGVEETKRRVRSSFTISTD
jgi:hypothetical protein